VRQRRRVAPSRCSDQPRDGRQASKDADPDTGKDSAVEASKDAGSDTGADAGEDTGSDTGADAGKDAGMEANGRRSSVWRASGGGHRACRSSGTPPRPSPTCMRTEVFGLDPGTRSQADAGSPLVNPRHRGSSLRRAASPAEPRRGSPSRAPGSLATLRRDRVVRRFPASPAQASPRRRGADARRFVQPRRQC
jgi:hypothetical protein